MLKVISPFVVPSRRRVRDSFTLVEILVVIAIIAILAAVALPAITGAIRKANESAAVQSAVGIELGCFQYSNDNNQTYPGGATGVIFFSALTNGYINNTDAFFIPGTTGKSKYTTGTLALANICWDATVQSSSNAGLTSSDPDQTPVIMSTSGPGTTYTYGNPGTAAAATVTIPTTGSINPFGTDGIAVAFKSGSAQFWHCTTPGSSFSISSASFNPTVAYMALIP
jgi:type IV pilus assembly protein PilA